VTKNNNKPSMISKIQGKTIKNDERMSVIDIEEIKLLYNCKNTAKLTSKKATVAVKNNIKKSLTFNIK
jgi:hypothetical protein